MGVQVKREDAYDDIARYTIVNDITNRDLVHRTELKASGSDWVLGKCLPGGILITGSPAGNGSHYDHYLRAGDVMERAITGIGT